MSPPPGIHQPTIVVPPNFAQVVTRLVLLALAYAATGILGLSMPYAGSHITLVWLPTGIAVAALLRWGWSMWPGVLIAAFLVNLSIGSSWQLAAGIALGNTLGPLLAAWLLHRAGFHPAFDRQKDVGLFIAAAAFGMTVSASCGVEALGLAGLVPPGAAASAWLSWWMGDTVGVLLAAPLLLTLTVKNLRQLGRNRNELLLWVLLAGPAAWLAFIHAYDAVDRSLPMAFLTLPLLAWSAQRFGSTGAALGGLGFSMVAAVSTAAGRGTFHIGDVHLGLFLLWSYMATTVLMGLLITALQAERAKVEETLRESEEKLRGLYELSPLGIALTDMQGQYVEFNEAFRQICGYSAEELKTLDYWTLTPKKYEADEARQLESLQRRGRYGPYEKEYVRKDGSMVPLRLNGMLITGDDGRNYIWSIVEDITDRRTAELAMARERTRLETLLRTASDGIHMLDADGLLTEANDAFLDMLGHDRTAVGRLHVADWDAGLHPEDIRGRIDALIAGTGASVFETRHRRRDGRVIDVEINACSIELEGRRFVYASSRDITERNLQRQQLRDLNVNLEAHVRQRTQELARANKELEAFSYSVSHDLRAPLRALDGYARLVREKDAAQLSGEGHQMLERICVNAGKMGALIDDILQFSRVGRHEMRFDDVDMTALARAVSLEMGAEYASAKVEIATLPHTWGDASMLRQVWANLIGNALKFSSRARSPQVEVGVAQQDGEAAYFVRDNGVGFDMAHAGKLFEAFQRMHTEKEFPGTGAGLAIVKRIVERHGGRVWAEAQPGQGATLFFCLGADSRA